MPSKHPLTRSQLQVKEEKSENDQKLTGQLVIFQSFFFLFFFHFSVVVFFVVFLLFFFQSFLLFNFFSFFLSPEQTILIFKYFSIFLKILIGQSLLTVSLSKTH